jgi:tail tube protein
MAAPGSGILTQFCGPVAEGTYGVAPALTGAHFYAIKGGESLASKKVTDQGQGLFSGKLHPMASRRVLAGWEAGGQIPLELPTRNLQQWLLPMFGSYGQAAATLTQDLTTGAYKSVHAPGPLQGNSFCVQKGVPAVDGTVTPFTYVGCKITDWEISVEKHGIAQLAVNVMARNELAGAGNADPLNASVPTLLAYSPPIGSVFHWAQATLFTGGTASTTSGVTSVSGASTAGNVRKISIKYTIPLDGDRYFLGKAGFRDEPVDNGLRTIAVSFEIEWLSSEAMYNAYAADTPTALQLQLQGPVIGSGTDHSMLSILIPEMFLDGEPPKIPGPQVVTQTIPLAGLDDAANNPIQATYWTLDTA